VEPTAAFLAAVRASGGSLGSGETGSRVGCGGARGSRFRPSRPQGGGTYVRFSVRSNKPCVHVGVCMNHSVHIHLFLLSPFAVDCRREAAVTNDHRTSMDAQVMHVQMAPTALVRLTKQEIRQVKMAVKQCMLAISRAPQPRRH
jgi:hypothetical protein